MTKQQKADRNRPTDGASKVRIVFGQATTVPAPANDNAEVANKDS